MAYLITCSGKKKKTIEVNPSSLQNLSYNDLLFESRKKLIADLDITLDWEKTLPAWKLYSGKIYSHIENDNWLKKGVQIKILSALFGWIHHTDRIPSYDLIMNKRIHGITPYIFWRNTGLIDQIVKTDDISILSKNYKKAFISSEIVTLLEPEVKFTDRGDQKGKWLNNELSKFQ